MWVWELQMLIVNKKVKPPPIFNTMTMMTFQNLDSRKEHNNALEPHILIRISYDRNVYVIFKLKIKLPNVN